MMIATKRRTTTRCVAGELWTGRNEATRRLGASNENFFSVVNAHSIRRYALVGQNTLYSVADIDRAVSGAIGLGSVRRSNAC
jgi:hypothetical protein